MERRAEHASGGDGTDDAASAVAMPWTRFAAPGFPRHPALRYGAAVAITLAASGIQRLCEPLWGRSLPFLFYFPSVMITAWLAGFGPGALATFLAAGISAATTRWIDASGLVASAVFVMSGLLISALNESLHQSMRRGERLREAREGLLAIVAHDLRSPLNAITLTVSVLRRARSAEQNERAIVGIERAAARMEHLIRDLVDATRLDSGGELSIVLTDEEASAIVTDALATAAPQAAAKRITLDAEVPPGLPRLRCDRERILQALGNVLTNAIKFTPEEGRVVLRVTPASGALRFEIADTGPGIPQEDVPHIFERHWRSRGSSGSGLGLYITDGIVKAHGGRTWVHSEPGLGASFFVTIPTAMSISPPAAETRRPSERFRLS
jgi:signal transduction histidine kinase